VSWTKSNSEKWAIDKVMEDIVATPIHTVMLWNRQSFEMDVMRRCICEKVDKKVNKRRRWMDESL